MTGGNNLSDEILVQELTDPTISLSQADPTSLDALLALGVSHTNELEQVHPTPCTLHPEP